MPPEKLRAMVDAIGDRYRALIITLAGSRLRPGEACRLTVDRVDFLRRTIRVDRKLITKAGQPSRFGPVMTTSSVRTIPVPQAVVHEIARRLATYYADPQLGVIFTDAEGKGIRRNALGHPWRRAAIKAKVEGFTPPRLPALRGISPHRPRRKREGRTAPPGHATASTKLDTYAHMFRDSEDVTRRALDAGLDAIVSSSCDDAAAADLT
jgi:integrase